MIKIIEQATGQANVDWINRDTARAEFATPPKPRSEPGTKGDASGHAFHGNRYTGGIGGRDKQSGISLPETGVPLTLAVLNSVKTFDKIASQEIASEEHRVPHLLQYPSEKLKDEVVHNVMAKSGLTYERATAMVKTWARSSSDTTPDSVALQIAAGQRFGVNPGAYIEGQAKFMGGGYQERLASGPPAPRTDVDNEGRLLMGKDDIEGHTDPEYHQKWNASMKEFTDAVGMSMQLDKTTMFVVPAAYAAGTMVNHGYGDYESRPFPGFGTQYYTPSEGFRQRVLQNGDIVFSRDNTIQGATLAHIDEYGAKPAEGESQPIPWGERLSDAQKVVEAIYSHTQEVLRDMGVKELTVFRGMNWYHPNVIPDSLLDKTEVTKYDSHGNAVRGIDEDRPMVRPGAYPIAMELNPLSSFSVNTRDALEFGAGDRGLVLGVRVRADRVFSLASSGVGCLHEGEVVVVGGPVEAFGGPGYPHLDENGQEAHLIFSQSEYHGA